MLSTIATSVLLEELRKRMGVQELLAPPYDDLEITIAGQIQHQTTGPACVFVIID